MPSKRQRVSDIAKADEAVGKGMLSHLGTSSPRVHNGAARRADRATFCCLGHARRQSNCICVMRMRIAWRSLCLLIV